MKEYRIYFPDEGTDVLANEGATLMEALIAAGIALYAPCGGHGTCGKCVVEIRKPGEALWQQVRACRTRVDGTLEVRLPHGEENLQVLTTGTEGARGAWNPQVRAVKISVPPCTRGMSTSDWTRLKSALCAAVGMEDWKPNLNICRELGKLLAETRGEIWAVVCGDRVLDVCRDEPKIYMAAFDLGTTSIAGYLLHANQQKVAVADGHSNPQAQFGGDVISRADYALSHGTAALAECAQRALDESIERMCAQAGVSRSRVYAVSLAGNTCMHHLFLNISPDSLVHAPYNPTVSEPLVLSAAEYGIHAHPAAPLFLLPVIGGFVGADTVACMLNGDWLRRDKLTLLIDFGTNGELVLGNCYRKVACSTAAGPAFEGAKIQCGMRGAEGAVDRVRVESGRITWHAIGDAEVRGLCGSGLVDLTAALLETGEMDGSGKLQSGEKYVLEGTNVFLSQKDIREIQLAKAAISAGITLMAKRLGVSVEDIEEVNMAGAFGNNINPDSACAIGLIPEVLRSRIIPVGNAAGEGAKLVLTDRKCWDEAGKLARTTEFLELATLPEFQDEFVDALAFLEEE